MATRRVSAVSIVALMAVAASAATPDWKEALEQVSKRRSIERVTQRSSTAIV